MWLSRSRFGVGSSPRMRGTLDVELVGHVLAGIIPAYAGNTGDTIELRTFGWDHPRVCGEHHMTSIMVHLSWGSSPRMRGTQSRCRPCMRRTGIIPAYAGNTRRDRSHEQYRQDHPRVCGEHSSRMLEKLASVGSSPRMRGTPVVPPAYPTFTGIIPAYAGNTPRPDPWTGFPGDHPRVCGEHQFRGYVFTGSVGSSPRMRGTQPSSSKFDYCRGIIPAYAGNTYRLLRL